MAIVTAFYLLCFIILGACCWAAEKQPAQD
jgi:hypothetical protein